jgi:hypothetical protein
LQITAAGLFLQKLASLRRNRHRGYLKALIARIKWEVADGGWQRDCSRSPRLAWCLLLNRAILREHLPNQFHTIFCSCKALAILYIVGSRGLSSAWPCPSSLKVDFRTAFEWVFAEQHAFGIFATDATGLSGTADDAAL